MEKVNNEFFISKVQAYLATANKDTNWLLEQTAISDVVWRNWVNGFKSPSLDSINQIALLFRNTLQINIHTPKQLIGLDMEFSLAKQVSVKSNINAICKKYSISNLEIYSSVKIPKNTVQHNSASENPTPNFNTTLKYFEYFTKFKKIDLKNHLELIYFPLWGESEFSYIELRNKIKLL